MMTASVKAKEAARELLGRYSVFWAVVSLLYTLVFVTIDFAGNPMTGFRGFMVLASQWCVVAFCSAGVIGLICAWRALFAVMFPLLVLFSAILSYFRLTMGIGLTPMAIELTVVNDVRTWSTVVSWQLVAVAVISVAVSLVPVIWRWRYVRTRRPLDWAVLSVFIIALPVGVVARIRPAVMSRMPYVFYYSLSQYLDNRRNVAEIRDSFDRVPAVAEDDSLDVVFVIGESLRSDHLQINGYGRPTTPGLAKERNLVSFPGMFTGPCFTHVSVPRIMTRADSLSPDRAYEEQSFISLFRKAGFRTLWISNQDVTDSYAYFMHETDSLIYANAGKSLYDYDKWMDIDILSHFRREGLRPGRNLTVIHSIGSHWWYKAHYDGKSARFLPDIDSRVVSELSREQMVNSYDNTIVETDRFLTGLIDMLRGRNAVLIYISDHGEALGEDGNYLHGDDYEPLHYPRAFVWWSDEYGRRHSGMIEALRGNAGGRHTTDEMFHSALDAGTVRTPALDPRQSFFRDE